MTVQFSLLGPHLGPLRVSDSNIKIRNWEGDDSSMGACDDPQGLLGGPSTAAQLRAGEEGKFNSGGRRHPRGGSAPRPSRATRRPRPIPAGARPRPRRALTSARRCFRRVSTSFLGSSTFGCRLLHIPVAPRRTSREAGPPAPRRSRRGSGRRVSRGPLAAPCPAAAASACRRLSSSGSRKEGGGRAGAGRRREGGVDAKPAAPPPQGGRQEYRPRPRHGRGAGRAIRPRRGRAQRRRESQRRWPPRTLSSEPRDAP